VSRLRASLLPATLLVLLSSSLLAANDGLIKTIAGAGQSGSTATGIPAPAAQITTPGGICADASNNLFIADSGNNRVVRVDAVTGLLTLVAGNGTAASGGDGGPAVLASIHTPMGVALDGAGNLYISEYQGYRIRRVDGQSGVITTVAGTGGAGFGGDGGPAASAAVNRAAGIAFDSAGNLYFADMFNNRVRRIDAQTGIVTTVAGTGSSISSADGVLATSAGIDAPIWVAIDPAGGLLISEWSANRIRRVDPSSGILSTVAGNGNANFTGDGVPATSAGIGGPLAMAVAANGSFFFADGTGRVRRVDAATGWITTVAGNGTGPHGMLSAAAGGGGGGGNPLPPCNPNVAGDNGPATSATLDGPFGLLLTADGNLLIADSLDCRVRRVNLPSPFSYTNTTLTASTTTLQPGQADLLTATVSPIGLSGVPTGALQFVDASQADVVVLATIALNGGSASYLNTAGNLGGHVVMAVYSGDLSFNGSGSPQIALSQSSATKYTATLALSANPSSSSLGAPTVFTATVTAPAGAGAAPSGPVVLVDGQTVVATANLVNGVATLSYVFTTPGNHAIVAVYLGDNNYSQVFTNLTQPVNSSTQVVITSSAPNAIYGQPIQITISVVPPSATGSIQLIVDQVPIPGSGTLTNGTVVAQPNPPLAAGSHTITAVYSGDANNPAATSPTFVQNVAKATPVFTVTSSQNPSVAGQAITLTVTMTPVSTGAGLDLQIGNPPAGLQATWSAGRTTITTADLSPGTHTVTGVWAGDANVLPGSSAVLTQTVQAVATTISLTASPNPSIYGAAVSLTANVLPAGATGQVVFSDNGVALGTANLASGQAQISIATLAAGSHSLTAAYAGDATHGGGSSAIVSQTVTQPTTPTSLTLISSANPSIAGRPLWLTATVSPSTATGTVQFLDGATVLGTSTIAGGWATLSVSTLPAATHAITALYSGDAGDSASTSAILSETIAPASPVVVTPNVITTLAGLPYSCNPGVSYCAMGHPAADAAGNIYYQDGYQILARSPAGVVSVIAGNGQQGTSGDGGPALAASLGMVEQIAVHGSRVCFGDYSAHKVRCVDIGTGLIQAYGTGIAQSRGDGGNVANASFDYPAGAAFDDAGNLYISDVGGNNVRRIDAVTAIITPLAGPGAGTGSPLGDGGPAVSASLVQPWGLSYSNGGIYIADSGNGRIRRVDLVTGMISSVTAAGPGSSFKDLAIDGAGNLFYTWGQAILMMDPSGNVSNIANPANSSGWGADDILATDTVFGGIGGIGWDPVARRLLIADQTRLRQIFFTPPATTALTLSPNPVVPGNQVALEATVSPASATGNVRFYRSNLLLGSAPLVNGVADFTWTAPIGENPSYGMRAVYGGDASDNLSLSATLTETLAQGTAQTTTSLIASPNPSVLGGSVTLSVTVSPAAASGSVAFYNNGVALGTAALAGGRAQFSVAALPAGSNYLMARYGGDLTYAGSITGIVTQIVVAAPTGVALTSSANPSVVGQSLTLTAAISPAGATGTVQFLDGAAALGTASVSAGSAALSVSTLSVGTHSITAIYSGDALNPAGTSAAVAQVVNKAASSVALASAQNPAVFGQSVALSASVTPASVTGTVQFVDGSTVLGTVTISGGAAAMSLSSLPVGTHSLTAVYSGDTNNLTSTSPVVTQTVNKAASSVTLVSSANPAVFGQTIPLSASVAPASATGTVQFVDGSTVLGTVTVSGGSAAMSLSTLAVGTHSVTAVYSGDANDSPATSVAITETVQQAPSTTTLASYTDRSPLGQTVNLSAAVTPASASGTVNLMQGTTILATSTLTNGVASFSISSLPVGSNSLYARYTGNASYLPSSSATVIQVVLIPTSTTLAAAPNPSVYGAPVTLTVTASPTSATGPVQFNNGNTILGTANLVNGQARLTVTNLPTGNASLIAYYSGDATHTGFTSLIVTGTVNKAPASMTLTSSKNPSPAGQSVTFTAAVSPNPATGSIQFLDGSTVLGTAAISGGAATLSLSSLSVGAHSIKASYSGDTNYLAATSPVLTQTISAPAQACRVTYVVTTQWNVGFGTAITIQNTGSAPLNGWNLTWTWPGNQKITQSWNATYTQTGANAKLTNESYNAAIAPGATLNGIGFNGSYSGTNHSPAAFYLNGTLCN
jgi:large repetitive protein